MVSNHETGRFNEEINIIKYLNQIISENKPYNLCLCPFTKLNIKRKI